MKALLALLVVGLASCSNLNLENVNGTIITKDGTKITKSGDDFKVETKEGVVVSKQGEKVDVVVPADKLGVEVVPAK